jgi:hypothetical protein
MNYTDGGGSTHEGPPGNARSSVQYALWSYRIFLDHMINQIAFGKIDRASPTVQTFVARAHRGHTDLKYKADQGYRCRAHNSASGNGADFSTAALGTVWGTSYTFGLWVDVLKPWLDG